MIEVHTLDVVFRQISTFLEDSMVVIYGLRGLPPYAYGTEIIWSTREQDL